MGEKGVIPIEKEREARMEFSVNQGQIEAFPMSWEGEKNVFGDDDFFPVCFALFNTKEAFFCSCRI